MPIHPVSLSTWYVLIAFFCVLLNAFFVAAEFAMVKIRATRLEELQSKGSFLAEWAHAIVQNLNAYLSATQLGITLASLGLGWIGEPAFAKLITPLVSSFSLGESTIQGISFTIAFLLITLLHLILGELVPKQIAIQTAEKVLLAVCIPLRIFYWVFFPFLWFLNHLTNLNARLMGFSTLHPSAVHSEDELRLIVEDSFEEGSISPRKASLLENVFEFTQQTTRHIMVPRTDIVYLQMSRSTEENFEIAKESGHTRFPLCDGDLDHVIGLINIKDIIWQLEDRDNLINLYDLKRPILFVPETKPIDQLLREFQAKKIHMAIVVDEFGAATGLLSLEDVLEEIVGDIQDEYDQEQPRIVKQSEDSYMVDGSTPIREVEGALDVNLSDATQVSIGGYFTHSLGRLVKEGDLLIINPYQVKALEVKKRRIVKLLFERMKEEIPA